MSLPPAQALNDTDGRYLREAIALADTARERGNRPFGALIVAADGRVLAEASNANGESGDCTAHAELSAIRLASPLHSRDELVGATLYSSAEPCVMCAGAIFWSAIGRVVYGIDAERLRVFRGERLDQKDAELSCRDVFQAASHAIECIGPALIEEASSSHQGAWKV
ncbi:MULTISPECIES: nucleoside deaminase [Comamonas]|uniref:nucleoside deaminase n=1 Tax=Comamonas TaxID=283 RepID=UPI0015FD8133|nr:MULTISPECIES: nucleoside deaminase [Comamonas]UUC93337.1 nucleoside deaminase [Comamonas sp. C11]WEE77332.1 nucleoside deaminase [Comamonas testosteroni]